MEHSVSPDRGTAPRSLCNRFEVSWITGLRSRHPFELQSALGSSGRRQPSCRTTAPSIRCRRKPEASAWRLASSADSRARPVPGVHDADSYSGTTKMVVPLRKFMNSSTDSLAEQTAGIVFVTAIVSLNALFRHLLRGIELVSGGDPLGYLQIGLGVSGVLVGYLLFRLRPLGLVGAVAYLAVAFAEVARTSPQFRTLAEIAGIGVVFLVLCWILLRNRDLFGEPSSGNRSSDSI